VVGLPADRRPRTKEEARRIECQIQFGITMLMQWWAINGVGTHAVWSDLGDETCLISFRRIANKTLRASANRRATFHTWWLSEWFNSPPSVT
jgi:hypothetical protein